MDKRCTKCGETKTPGEFFTDRHTRDGLHTHCRTCRTAARRAYYQGMAERRLAERKARTAKPKLKPRWRSSQEPEAWRPKTKRCSKCNTMKSADDFHQDNNAGDGLNPRCRACVSTAGKLHRQEIRKRREAVREARVEADRLEARRQHVVDLYLAQHGKCVWCLKHFPYVEGLGMLQGGCTGKIWALICPACERDVPGTNKMRQNRE